MKILSLRFKNINSLKGEWKIDFTREPFASSGLFAITGPTAPVKPPCSTPSAGALSRNLAAGQNLANAERADQPRYR